MFSNQQSAINPSVVGINKAVQPLEPDKITRRIEGGFSFKHYGYLPVFSVQATNNFVHKFPARSQEETVLTVINGEACIDVPLTASMTCAEVYKLLASQFQGAHFVVQLGDLLFRLEDGACSNERWVDVTKCHRCTVITCRQEEDAKQDNNVAALHMAGYANPFVVEEKVADKNASYHVVFLNTAGSFVASTLVRSYAPDYHDAGGGWICGATPNLPGAQLWAPTRKNDAGDWLALLNKLKGPVRLMICYAMKETRFVSSNNHFLFEQLRQAFWLLAVGKLDLVVCGEESWDKKRADYDIQVHGYNIANEISRWLNIPCEIWLASNTQALFTSLREDHGVPLYRVIGNTKAKVPHERIVCNSLHEEYLKSIASTIAIALDIDLTLRAIKLFNSGVAAPIEKILSERLQGRCRELAKPDVIADLQQNRIFIENIVHKLRRVDPVSAVVPVTVAESSQIRARKY